MAFSIVSFNNGEVTQEIDCRADIGKYLSSCRQLKNMIPLIHGDATRRPGTRFVKPAFSPISIIVSPSAINIAVALPEPTLIFENHTELADAINVAVAVPPVVVDENRPDWPGGFPDGVDYDQCPPDIDLAISGMTACECFCDQAQGDCYNLPSTGWWIWVDPPLSASETLPLISGTYGDCLYEKTIAATGALRFHSSGTDCSGITVDLDYDEVFLSVRVLGSSVVVGMFFIDTSAPIQKTGWFFKGTGTLDGQENVSVSNDWDDCLMSDAGSNQWLNTVTGGTAIVS